MVAIRLTAWRGALFWFAGQTDRVLGRLIARALAGTGARELSPREQAGPAELPGPAAQLRVLRRGCVWSPGWRTAGLRGRLEAPGETLPRRPALERIARPPHFSS
jgi:hypothetical protein